MPDHSPTAVMRCADLDPGAPAALLARYRLVTVALRADATIPGSYWGAPEAGLIGNTLYLRADTPIHSVLHESCHYVCMDRRRRAALHTNAGGDDTEECAVCYLSIRLAEYLRGYGRTRMLADMDSWGYSFRRGSARAWFEGDAEDAREWLRDRALIDARGAPTWRLCD